MKTKELTIKKEINPVIEQVSTMSLTTPSDMVKATSVLSQLNTFLDKLTDEKEKLTVPLNTALKEIRGRYKPTETLLEEAINTLKKKMGTYQAEAMKLQKEQEAKIASKVASGYIKVDTAIAKLGEIESPEEKLITDEGTASFRTVKKFEVMDITMLASVNNGFFITPNDVAIRQAMKEGRELAGIRYYEEQSVVNNRK